MTGKLRARIRKWHLDFDALAGQLGSNQPLLGMLAGISAERPAIANFEHFGYSKYSHFKCFESMPIYRTQSPATCDLKVYQDLFVYTFIRNNIKPGARLLEIGGGESRVLPALKDSFEVWNLDKLEGVGFGPKRAPVAGDEHLVRDYLGAFNRELPDAYFDLVFSISTVEHFPNEAGDVNRILDDLQRLLRPGGRSLHCIDALMYPGHYYVHPFVARAHELIGSVHSCLDFQQISQDEDLWTLPAFSYYTRWYHLTRQLLRDFGHPFSLNILW